MGTTLSPVPVLVGEVGSGHRFTGHAHRPVGHLSGAPTHDSLAGGPHRLGRWSQPAFGASSAPRDPEVRLGREGRAGTIAVGACVYFQLKINTLKTRTMGFYYIRINKKERETGKKCQKCQKCRELEDIKCHAKTMMIIIADKTLNHTARTPSKSTFLKKNQEKNKTRAREGVTPPHFEFCIHWMNINTLRPRTMGK